MSWTRREVLAAAGGASLVGCGAAKPPNILFLFPDQLRWDWLGTTPNMPLRTPVLSALADRGVLFERAWCPSPLCAPSRACLAAGMEYERCGVADNGDDYPLDSPTFYQSLRDSGYHVTGCGKFDLHKATQDWGLDGKYLLPEWGFSDGIDNAGKFDAVNSGAVTPVDPYMGFLHQESLAATHVADFDQRRGRSGYSNVAPTPLPDHAYCDNWTAENGVSLLRSAPTDRPWFLQVNFAGPHNPLDITESMMPLHAETDGLPAANQNTQFSAEQHVAMRRNYSAMVENIDSLCGRLIDEVRARGELENTIIIFSSDHGEMLGDHDLWAKVVPWEPSAGVPLIVAGPGVRQGVRTPSPASVVDVAATCLDYAGLPVPSEMDSRSLRPLLSGETESHRELLLSGLWSWRAVTDGQYKLVRGYAPGVPGYSRDAPYAEMRDLPPMLFDLAEDPLENRNIADQAPDLLRRLDEALAG